MPMQGFMAPGDTARRAARRMKRMGPPLASTPMAGGNMPVGRMQPLGKPPVPSKPTMPPEPPAQPTMPISTNKY